ncbi:D-alanyl-D-alanine carboxypeptidase family protein [Desulforhopalus singaporensis]|nr:D-alanyl-D-alanine carboxypeptidase family protein [Desulforhopalus singaporensis]
MIRTALFLVFILIAYPGWALGARVSHIARAPYLSAIVVDAQSGKILFEKNGDQPAYPASVLKLMDLLIILDQIKTGRLRLDEMVQVTKEAARMGGSQVYLDPREQFPVNDLLYALMIQSANDAAVALATHVAGSKEAFVSLMNRKAKELGMTNSRFHSVHGLPPGKGQEVDVTTARDLAILARELTRYPEVFQYTATRVKEFREGEFVMRTHNHLLDKVYGCDGFKTGYFAAAGFSIVATAKRNGVRIISVVLGSESRKIRDAKAAELLETGFAMVPPPPAAAEPKQQTVTATKQDSTTTRHESTAEIVEKDLVDKTQPTSEPGKSWQIFLAGVVSGLVLYGAFNFIISRKKSRRYQKYTR